MGGKQLHGVAGWTRGLDLTENGVLAGEDKALLCVPKSSLLALWVVSYNCELSKGPCPTLLLILEMEEPGTLM